METIRDWEIVYLGCEFSDYFQGFGTSFTNYAHCEVGCGDTIHEALDDMLEQVACGTELEIPLELEREVKGLQRDIKGTTDYSAREAFERDYPEEAAEGCEMPMHRIGIRFN